MVRMVQGPRRTVVGQGKRRRPLADYPLPGELRITLDSTSGMLLQWLLRYPFQRVEDWALVIAVERSTAARQIAKVEHLGLIECVSPALGSGPSNFYYLNAAGVTTLAALEQVDPAELARAAGADERGLLRLLSRLPALVYLQNVVNGLVARAPVALAPAGSQMEVGWQWRRDYGHGFTYHQQQFHCVADALVVFHLHPMSDYWEPEQEQWFSAFIVLDVGLTGNHDERLMRDRLALLLRYRECEERIARYRYFAPVLILAQTPRQQEYWLKAARDAAAALRLNPLVGAVACVPREADVPSAWPLPWKTLIGGASCRLQDLLVPMPRQGLPAGALGDLAAQVAPLSGQERRRPVALTGRFSERARALGQEGTQAGRSERETLALLGLYLDRRHFDIVQALYRWPLVTNMELAALLDLRKESVERYLYELRHTACIEEHPTSFGLRLCLSSRGLRLVAQTLGVSVLHIAATVTKDDLPRRGQCVRLLHELDNYPQFTAPAGATGTIVSTTGGGITVHMDEPLAGTGEELDCITWRVRPKESLRLAFTGDCELLQSAEDAEYGEMVQRSIRVLLRRLVDDRAAVRHLAGVYNFFAHLHLAARAQGHQVRWWETGSRCERRYRDHGSWHNLRPDAAMEYVAGERRLQAWLEWDEGTMTRANLGPKLDAYETFISTLQWSKERTRILPVLLVVAPNREQEKRVAEMALGSLAKSRLLVCSTTASRINTQGVLGPIWAQIVPAVPTPVVRRSLPDVKGTWK